MFLQATERMSKSRVPLLHEVIPMIDLLTNMLQTYIDDLSAFPAIRAAARRGRDMLNKYYSKTDTSVMFRVAMSAYNILHLF